MFNVTLTASIMHLALASSLHLGAFFTSLTVLNHFLTPEDFRWDKILTQTFILIVIILIKERNFLELMNVGSTDRFEIKKVSSTFMAMHDGIILLE